jgi:hypothetical protein
MCLGVAISLWPEQEITFLAGLSEVADRNKLISCVNIRNGARKEKTIKLARQKLNYHRLGPAWFCCFVFLMSTVRGKSVEAHYDVQVF